MLKLFVILLAVTTYCQPFSVYGPAKDAWNLWKAKYRKEYGDPHEEGMRFAIFAENLQNINEHNLNFAKGKETFSLGVNQFADLLRTEFAELVNGFNKSQSLRDKEEGGIFIPPENIQLPDEIDWRTKGAVTPVKNQEQCGSCWAFSATGSLEGQHFRKNGTLVSLSEQNLVDCSAQFGNDGCSGGLMDNAFTYVKANRGIDTEQSYPYLGIDSGCQFNRKAVGADDAGFIDIPSGSESHLQAAVASVGPISVAIDASSSKFQFYKGGVYYLPSCSTDELDHGVLAVGYGNDRKTGMDYWLVKNSWGLDWGEDGYIRMARNKHNMCGIATQASYPIVK